MRKALKMKDDDETLNLAMQDDLKASGYNKDEIQDIMEKQEDQEQNYSDHSSIDSADKRKSKLLSQLRMSNEGVNTSNDIKPLKKLVSKKERARLAFKAERSRQSLLKPKGREPETVWQQQQRFIRQRAAPNVRARKFNLAQNQKNIKAMEQQLIAAQQ